MTTLASINYSMSLPWSLQNNPQIYYFQFEIYYFVGNMTTQHLIFHLTVLHNRPRALTENLKFLCCSVVECIEKLWCVQ